MWLAQLGKERIDEVADPEIAIDRAFQTYLPAVCAVSGDISVDCHSCAVQSVNAVSTA